MGVRDPVFWDIVAPLRSDYVADACDIADAWVRARPGGIADELFVSLVLIWDRLTPDDRDIVAEAVAELLAERTGGADAIVKSGLLRALEAGLVVEGGDPGPP